MHEKYNAPDRPRFDPLTAPCAPLRPGPGFRLMLICFVGIGPVSTDLYLPALPLIAQDLGTGPEMVQATLGVFVGGFAVAQLLYGPLADRFGRRPVIFGALLLYCAATLACALAPSIESLLVARFVQALGGCAGPVVGRAIVRDLFQPREAAAMLGYLASAMALAPMLAPFLGGYLAGWFGWEATFLALLVFGVAITLAVWRALPETKPAGTVAIGLGGLFFQYGRLLQDRLFLGCSLAAGAGFGMLFTWISNSSFLLIDYYGQPVEGFAWFFAVCAGAFVLGALTAARMGKRYGIAAVLRTSMTGIVLGSTLLAGLWAADTLTAWRVTLCFAVIFALTGGIIPTGTAGALVPYPMMAGTASALAGALTMSMGVIANVLSALILTDGPGSTVWVAVMFATIGFAAVFLVVGHTHKKLA